MRPRTDDEILEDLKDWPVRNIYVERGVKLIEQLRQRVQELTAERDALKQQRDDLLAALEDSVSVAKDALDHWDQDRDMKVGKLLHALSGLVKGYDSRADAVHNAIASVKEKS